MKIDSKSRLKNISISACNFHPFSNPFWVSFSLKIVKLNVLKCAFRMRHPSKMEPLAKNGLQKVSLNNHLKNKRIWDPF